MADSDIWTKIAAPLDPKQIKTRKVVDKKSGNVTHLRYISRVDVINRLNSVVPGDWQFQVEMISTSAEAGWVCKGSLTIMGVTREDFGMPEHESAFDPPKAAASDALKRCASQFGFASELYGEDYEGEREPGSNGASPESPSPDDRPRTAEATKIHLQKDAKERVAVDGGGDPIDEAAVRKLVIQLNKVFANDDERHVFTNAIYGVPSLKQLDKAQGRALYAWATNIPMAKQEKDDVLAVLDIWFEQKELPAA